jgi:hypothetical protein
MPNTSDAWRNVDARGLVLDLADRGITLGVVAGRVRAAPAELLTAADEAALRRLKADVMVIILACDERTIDRLLLLRRGTPVTAQGAGGCYLCGGEMPPDRSSGRCGWCSVAARLYAGGPVPRDVIDLFPTAIRGVAATDLSFDLKVPA